MMCESWALQPYSLSDTVSDIDIEKLDMELIKVIQSSCVINIQ